MEITKEEFEAYESVRASGITNMFNIKVVEQLSDLTREKILYIMEHYGELKEKWKPE